MATENPELERTIINWLSIIFVTIFALAWSSLILDVLVIHGYLPRTGVVPFAVWLVGMIVFGIATMQVRSMMIIKRDLKQV